MSKVSFTCVDAWRNETSKDSEIVAVSLREKAGMDEGVSVNAAVKGYFRVGTNVSEGVSMIYVVGVSIAACDSLSVVTHARTSVCVCGF